MHRDETLWMAFWGAITRVTVPTTEDRAHLEYYFRDYLTAPTDDPAVSVTLGIARGHSPYLDSDPAERWVEVIDHSANTVSSLTGSATVHGRTPLPPFTLGPLASLFRTVHAAAVVHPSNTDSALLILGQSTSGKSSLAMTFADRAWGFLSDDTVPIAADGRARPFTRPVGVRSAAARRFGVSPERFGSARLSETATGSTISVHPRDLGWTIATPARVRWAVTLERDEVFEARRLTARSLLLRLDVDHHHDDAVRAIEEMCGV